MPALDWIFAGVLLVSLVLGAWRGLIYEVLSLVTWVAAFIIAQWYAPDLAQKLPMADSNDSVRYAAGFVLAFVLAVLAGSLVASLAKKLFAVVGLQPADRALGAVFGLLRGAVVLLAATVVIGMTAFKTSDWWQESSGAGLSLIALKQLAPLLPTEFVKYFPNL